MKRINYQVRILNSILIAVMLVGFLGFPSTTKAEDNMPAITAKDAGIIAGVAVGIGIIVGMVTRSKNTDSLKSASKEETSTAYFLQEQSDTKETLPPFQQLEFHITILNLRF
ncbi:MAG: hypothetical protein HZB54_07415 [Deltaproteobacteria bacterium]|nr:hypothetical protein [Deltaproteobacteria bacterium]